MTPKSASSDGQARDVTAPGPQSRRIRVDHAISLVRFGARVVVGISTGLLACTPLKDDRPTAALDAAEDVDGTGDASDGGDAVPDSDTGPTAYASCKQLHESAPDAGSGNYVLYDGRRFTAYCDMDLLGGGWTAIYSGINGSPHVHPSFADVVDWCPDPKTECVHRAPFSLTTETKMLVTCGANAIMFNLHDEDGVSFFTRGSQLAWVKTDNRQSVANGVDPELAAQIWTGNGPNGGWIVSANDHDPDATTRTFSSAYNALPGWDYCAGTSDTTSTIHIFYR